MSLLTHKELTHKDYTIVWNGYFRRIPMEDGFKRKKYVIIGGSYRCAKTKIYKKIHPKKLVKLYNLNINECMLFMDEKRFTNPNHRTNRFYYDSVDNHAYILRTRKNGDYENHIAERKATRLLEDKPT